MTTLTPAAAPAAAPTAATDSSAITPSQIEIISSGSSIVIIHTYNIGSYISRVEGSQTDVYISVGSDVVRIDFSLLALCLIEPSAQD
jgi:hypothetical protein